MNRILKILFLILILFLYSCNRNNVNSKLTNYSKNLETLCKTWGFLKYYYPEISTGCLNWDSVLISNIDVVLSLKSSDSVKKFFETFVPQCSELNFGELGFSGDSIFYKNLDYTWLEDTAVFSNNTIMRLKCISNNPFDFDNKYISKNKWVKNPIFDHDTLFNNIVLPNQNTRLLSLFRYWNIINYYYPYKYLTDTPWDSVLTEFIPIFMEAKDTLSYHLAVCMLAAKINDNHSYTTSEIIENFYGDRFLPVKFQLRESKTIVTEAYSDSLAELNGLEIGDVLLSINNLSITEIRDSLSYYFSGSNQNTLQNTVTYFLNRSSSNKLNLRLYRNDTSFSIQAQTYSRELLSEERRKKISNNFVDTISESIIYIDLSRIDYNNVETTFSGILNYKNIIIDLRKNCQFIIHDLSNLLFAKKFEFYSVLTAVYQKPGLFSLNKGDSIGPEKPNKKPFKGNLILLVNENTQSIGEFTAMALSKYDKAILIGRPTAGADGNISIISLPGRISTIISGIGIYWPDGSQTQRCGINPDIIVSSKLESVVLNRDDILEQAINYTENTMASK